MIKQSGLVGKGDELSKYIGLLFIFLLLIPVPISAHSYLIESNPAEGDEVTEAVNEIILIFNAAIESVSTATVFNLENEEIAIEEIEVESPVLKLSLTDPLLPGSYTVEWRALGEDTHQIEGSYSFEVLEYEVVDAIEEKPDLKDSVEFDDERNEEIPTREEEAVVEPSLGRLLLPILITGAIGLIFLVEFIIKRAR
ncbi:copper resistance CopC family protein [Alkalihalobacillus deserti]|uniref:copper resistance CopC family protein n=1 Tax=Alkalihalobacillus deserti TaxID=2879466 RepID=UPI001D142F2A|nr:copper resistance protein CopC [Alkalihalobacillus deserti]